MSAAQLKLVEDAQARGDLDEVPLDVQRTFIAMAALADDGGRVVDDGTLARRIVEYIRRRWGGA